MKSLLFLLFFLIATSAFCQSKGSYKKSLQLPLNGSNVEYTGSVSIDSNISKEQLLHNAQEWYRRHFQSSDNRLTVNNTEDGIISGPGIIHATNSRKQINAKDIFFTIDIIASVGSYQYSADSIYSFEGRTKFYYSDMYSEEMYTPTKPKWTRPYRQDMLANMNTRMSAMIEKLKGEMTNNKP